MANLLDTDFGSESEDDNFNPAPAMGSDDEGLGDSDIEENVNHTTNRANSSRQSEAQDLDNGDAARNGDTDITGQRGTSGVEDLNGDEEDDEEDGADGHKRNGDGMDDEEEDEEDEEDEDDEDAVTVSLRSAYVCNSCLINVRDDLGNVHVEILETSLSTSKPR